MKKVINRGLAVRRIDVHEPTATDYALIKVNSCWLVLCEVEEIFDMVACTQETVIKPLKAADIPYLELLKEEK